MSARRRSGRSPVTSAPRAVISRRSAPAQNARPAPVMHTARTVSSSARSRRAARSASVSPTSRALSDSGLFISTVAVPPFWWITTMELFRSAVTTLFRFAFHSPGGATLLAYPRYERMLHTIDAFVHALLITPLEGAGGRTKARCRTGDMNTVDGRFRRIRQAHRGRLGIPPAHPDVGTVNGGLWDVTGWTLPTRKLGGAGRWAWIPSRPHVIIRSYRHDNLKGLRRVRSPRQAGVKQGWSPSAIRPVLARRAANSATRPGASS